MDKIIRNSAYGLIMVAATSLLFHAVGAFKAYYSGALAIKVIDASAILNHKVIPIGDYTSDYTAGTLQIKPTLFQSFLFYNGHFSDHGAGVVFFLLLGIILILALKFRSDLLLNLSGDKFYQCVGLVGLLYLAICFGIEIPTANYLKELTNHAFRLDNNHADYSIFNLLSLFILLNAILQLHTYAKQLKAENDLTI